MLFTIVGAIISIVGVISGIVVGISFNNLMLCLYVMIGTFLYAIIYFGIGKILKNQEKILSIIAPEMPVDNDSLQQGKASNPETEETALKEVSKNDSKPRPEIKLSSEQIAMIQQYIKNDEKYKAVKTLSEITGMDIKEALDEIDKYTPTE